MVVFPFWLWTLAILLEWLKPVKKIGIVVLRGLWWATKWLMILLLSCEGCYWLDRLTR